MEILRVAVPSGKQCNQLTTDNGAKYYFNDEGQINDNLFVVSANPLVAVDEAAKNDLGVVDGTGNVIIPTDKKEIKKIEGVDDYLLVVEANPTDPKVLDAINKQNDPGFRPQIANEMAEIEAQIMAEMNRDGTGSKILFADSYSQAGLYDLNGNRVAGTECSFVGQNSTGIYFHDNVKGSASQKMKVEIPVNTDSVFDTEDQTPNQPQIPTESAPTFPFTTEQPQASTDNFGINMNEDGSFANANAMFNTTDSIGVNDSETIPKVDLNENNVASDLDALPADFFDKMQGLNTEVEKPKNDKEVKQEHHYSFEEPEENNIDTYVEPEEPDALISDAIEKFEESYSVVENLKKVIDKRDEKYENMVAEYEKKLARKDEEHHKKIEELNYKYDTDVAKLKNHGANWQSRYQRANARAEVLDEEGKKKTDTIEKLRGQLRAAFEETSKLKTEVTDLSAKYETINEELKTEQKKHKEAEEKANSIQEENNRLIKGRSRLIENMRNMTRQINSVQELVKGVMPEESTKMSKLHENNYVEAKAPTKKIEDEDLVDFSLGNSLTNIPVAFSEDENYSYKENI